MLEGKKPPGDQHRALLGVLILPLLGLLVSEGLWCIWAVLLQGVPAWGDRVIVSVSLRESAGGGEALGEAPGEASMTRGVGKPLRVSPSGSCIP